MGHNGGTMSRRLASCVNSGPDPSAGPARPEISRRAVIRSAAALIGCSAAPGLLPRSARAAAPGAGVEWYVTTATSPWQKRVAEATPGGSADVIVQTDTPLQAIEGFGACFNELGWTSLAALSAADRESVLRELFAPGVGAGFTLCRMPVGANDFSRDWYSYDETDGDFALEHFTHRERPRDARPLHPGGAEAPARAEALGVAVEPAHLDEEEQALRDGDAGTLAEGRRERPAARPGRPRGHRHVRPGGALPPRLRLLLRALRGRVPQAGHRDRHGDAAERVQLGAGVPELLLDGRGPGAVHRAPRPRDGEARRRGLLRHDGARRTRGSST